MLSGSSSAVGYVHSACAASRRDEVAVGRLDSWEQLEGADLVGQLVVLGLEPKCPAHSAAARIYELNIEAAMLQEAHASIRVGFRLRPRA